MSNLPESPVWEDGIYQLEETDPVEGGPDGIDNLQAKQLANRTTWLKEQVETASGGLESHEAAEDPHPQYLTKDEGDVLFRSLQSAVNKGGDTMEGPLTLAGNPTLAMHAVPKQYVDSLVGQGNAAVRKPVNSTPAANAVGVSTTITLSASAYYSLYGIAQSAAQFQVSTVADFSSTVRDTTLGAVSSWAVSPVLSSTTQYYWRVRYKDAENTWSDWSTPTLFSTGAAVITQPSLTSPASGATGISRTPTLTSSAFAVTGGADTHASSRWRVATDAAFTNLVVDSGNSTAAKTSYTLGTNLNYGTTYYARVMHNGTALGGSSWSNAASFTVLAGEVTTPSITSPTSGATGVSMSPSLTSSAFAYAGAADTHAMTDWEIRTAANGGGTLTWSSTNNSTNKVNITASGLSGSTTYYARCRHKGTTYGWSAWSADVSFTTQAAAGQQSYTTAGSYSFIVPAGVGSISAAGLGGGGGGGGGTSETGGGGGAGGALAYVNNVAVTPGETLTVEVGDGGSAGSATGTNGSSGGWSRLLRGATVLLSAGGGPGGNGGQYSGTGAIASQVLTGTGGVGGRGGDGGGGGGGGGGGAGGYGGSGGRGGQGSGSGPQPGFAGSGGGGGGGGGGEIIYTTSTGTSQRGGGGGGNTITGQAGNGSAGGKGEGGGGSSVGNDGSSGGQNSPTSGRGGMYGAGGGGGNQNLAGAAGMRGFVRILWPGTSRSYPSTNTADM